MLLMTDTLISAFLVLIVVRQIREAKLELHILLLPVVLVGLTAQHYLHDLSLGGNDGALIATLAATGALFGALGGLHTRVRRDGDDVFIRAGRVSVGLWISSMGARAIFVYAIAHGFAADVARFSMAHGITGQSAWTVALISMAVGEVVVRMAVIFIRGHRVPAAPPALAAA